MAHYKRRSRSPRVNMDADERTPPTLEEKDPPYFRRKNTSYCKKGKGPHHFILETEKRYEHTVIQRDLSETISWLEVRRLRCTVCGKMKRHYASSH